MEPRVTQSNPVVPDHLFKSLQEKYGPLIGGKDLWMALGYRTRAAFAKAARNGTLGIPVFSLPHRRGRFALTRDLAIWLISSRQGAQTGFQNTKREGDV